MRKAVIGRNLDHIASVVKAHPEFRGYLRLSPRSIRTYGASRGYSLDEVVVFCRWAEWHDFDDVLDMLMPCFATSREPQIRWVFEF